MALLDRTHPLVARFKLRGQAIALIKRTLNRVLTEDEKSLFSSNDLLKGLSPDSPSTDRQATLAKLEQDQTADDAEIAKEASTKRAQLDTAQELKNLEAAEQTFASISDESLESQRVSAQQIFDAAQTELRKVMQEVQRRDRIATLLKKLGATTDTDKVLLHKLLSPGSVASGTKVGALGT